jgi:hypothetical protein
MPHAFDHVWTTGDNLAWSEDHDMLRAAKYERGDTDIGTTPGFDATLDPSVSAVGQNAAYARFYAMIQSMAALYWVKDEPADGDAFVNGEYPASLVWWQGSQVTQLPIAGTSTNAYSVWEYLLGAGNYRPTRRYPREHADGAATAYTDGASFANGDKSRNLATGVIQLRSAGAWVDTADLVADVVTTNAYTDAISAVKGDILGPWLLNEARDAMKLTTSGSYVHFGYANFASGVRSDPGIKVTNVGGTSLDVEVSDPAQATGSAGQDVEVTLWVGTDDDDQWHEIGTATIAVTGGTHTFSVPVPASNSGDAGFITVCRHAIAGGFVYQ